MGRRGLGCLLLAGALLRGVCPSPARAEDAPGVAAPLAGAVPELRLYPVRSLLRGHPVYQGDRGPFPVAPEEVNDEAQPLFGGEFGDRTYGLGWPDEVVSTIQAEVAETGASADGTVSIGPLHVAEGLTGDGFLTVQAPRAQQARVAAWLDRSSRNALRTVVVDVVAFRGDAAAARAEGGVPAAVVRGAWVPLGALRMTMHPSGGAVGRVGALRAYLQDDDVEVAIDASSTVAIVGVAPEGLSVEAASVPAEGDRVSVHLRGWWASPGVWGAFPLGRGDRIEAPETEGASFEATVSSSDGAWALLPGAGAVVFAARVRVEGVPPSSAPPEGVLLSPSGSAPAEGPLVSRTYPVDDLLFPVASNRGWTALLAPTNFTPPEPPDVPPAAPPFPVTSVTEILRRAVWPGTWDRSGAALDVSARGVRARTDEARQAEVAALLERLRAVRRPSTSVRVRVVALPWASLPEWWTGFPEDLAKDDGAALLARAGARVVEDDRLPLLDGQRRAAVTGTRHTYVAGYSIEIADKSVIGKPIVSSLFEGSSLDLEGDPVFGAPAANLSLRLDAGRVLESRSVPTQLGTIECPRFALVRSRGEATVPYGTTRIVAAWASGDEIRLCLVTASRE